MKLQNVILSAACVLLHHVCFGAGAPPQFGTEELKNGLSRSVAAGRFTSLGYKLVTEPGSEQRVTIRDSQSNEVLGSLYFCGNKLFANSVQAHGGIGAMIRRASQLSAKYGKASVEAESKLESFGEVSTLTLQYGDAAGMVTLQFTPESLGVGESQWVTTSVPQVCVK